MKISENSQKYKVIAFNENKDTKFFGTCNKEELVERLKYAREILDKNWRLCVSEILYKQKKGRKNYKLYSIDYSKHMNSPMIHEKYKHLFLGDENENS